MKKENLNGKEYWRSLDQLADTDEYREFLEREFPEGASELNSPVKRRNFLKLMGASIALAGLAACRRPVEKIIPYVAAPEEIIPGIPQYFATTMPFGNEAFGLVVESHEGRPTKIEGNKKHPSTFGASTTQIQATMLDLYDPDRSQSVLNAGAESSWSAFLAFWKGLHAEFVKSNGEGLAVLSEAFSSPSLYRAKKAFEKTFPKAKWYSFEAVSDENIFAGCEAAFGKAVRPVYNLDKAKVVLSVDSDFMQSDSDAIRNARGFADGRRVTSEKDDMNRLYAVESVFTITGGMADHRLRLSASQIPALVAAIAMELRRQGIAVKGTDGLGNAAPAGVDAKWIQETAKDLAANKGQSLIIAGRRQSMAVHALVVAINEALQNNGKTVNYYALSDSVTASRTQMQALSEDLSTGAVKTLVMMGGNPLFDAPADLDFSTMIQTVAHTIHLAPSVNETSEGCEWHLPMAHYLESWGDARAADGTKSVIQPLIEPLFDGRSALDLTLMLNSGTEQKSYDFVRATWKNLISGNLEKNWRRVLHDGVLENSAEKPQNVKVGASAATAIATMKFMDAPTRDNLETIFMASPAIHDGRFANNGWLQELPDSVSKLAWDNAALMSLSTAQALGVKNEDLVVLAVNGKEVALPVWIQSGMADYSIALTLGYGRKVCGRIGKGVGVNVYPLRSVATYDLATGVKLQKTTATYPLANTQDHNSMEERPIVREATLAEYKEHPDFAPEMVEHLPLISLWEEHSYDTGYQWGMSIDLNVCNGCNGCTVACQSENNIPIVGKEQVKKGREMHWMRMDRYFAGDIDDPEMVFQPVACQQCENAPCEQVCPVQATSHDKEGLNVMTYNRCIGTRYCSNNCPYKVRRFNFFNYTKDLPEIVQLAQNPDVTIRSRGVMEKCTYCTQRINAGKMAAKLEDRTVQDGEIQAACQQACPTNAIVFGNINDPESAVSKAKTQNRDYALLGELNIKPRTTYLAKLRNPNPALENLS